MIGAPTSESRVGPMRQDRTKQIILLPSAVSANLYCRELGRAYLALGFAVVFGADNLAEPGAEFDLVHLHWPEEHYRWRGQGTIESRGERFITDLDRVKAAGARLIWTVHNIAPHDHFDNPRDRGIYQAVIDRADVIVHHCSASIDLLGRVYRIGPGTTQIVVPHGHFFAYPCGVEKAEARRRLGLPAHAFVFLSFGMVRAYKGLDLLLRAYDMARVPHKKLCIAGRYMSTGARSGFADRLRMAWIKRFKPGVHTYLQDVMEEEVQLHFMAADVLVLSHRAVLNSGVAVLGMSFGKPVIGPRLGCLPALIDTESNLLYEADDPRGLARAMEQSTKIDLGAAAVANKAAAARWDWIEIARQVIAAAKR